MRTVLTESIAEAAGFIKRGGIVAFPTETVYGLGADAFSEAAIAKIFAAKQRPADNPLIAHVAGVSQISLLAANITASAQKFIDAFFPGTLTIVLPKSGRVPLIATAGLETIGVRMPGHALALEFLQLCGTAVVAPSANLSGRPSPTTWQAVFEDLDGRIDCILKGAAAEVGLESTVVDCTGEVPLILRSGAVTLEQLQAVLPETQNYQAENTENIAAPRSPGLKHKHYSPRAAVTLIAKTAETRAGKNSSYIGLDTPENSASFGLVKTCDSVAEYANTVFEFFRESDRRAIGQIYCQRVIPEGLGAALMDRLRRAAEG